MSKTRDPTSPLVPGCTPPARKQLSLASNSTSPVATLCPDNDKVNMYVYLLTGILLLGHTGTAARHETTKHCAPVGKGSLGSAGSYVLSDCMGKKPGNPVPEPVVGLELKQ